MIGVMTNQPIQFTNSDPTNHNIHRLPRLGTSSLGDAYIPTGFKGYDGNQRGVPGHRFGLELAPAEKDALIAFLKTL